MPDLTALRKQLRVWDVAYYTWYTTFIILSLISIVLPLILASGLIPDTDYVTLKRILALVTAVCVGVLGWANIGAAGAKFDQARTLLRVALVSFPNDHSKLDEAYRAAMNMTPGSGPIIPPTNL